MSAQKLGRRLVGLLPCESFFVARFVVAPRLFRLVLRPVWLFYLFALRSSAAVDRRSFINPKPHRPHRPITDSPSFVNLSPNPLRVRASCDRCFPRFRIGTSRPSISREVGLSVIDS
jgi:hypothetical protein